MKRTSYFKIGNFNDIIARTLNVNSEKFTISVSILMLFFYVPN